MREIEVKKWCDWHVQSGDREVATVERTISIDGQPARSLDLCTPCDDLFFVDLVALVDAAPHVEKPIARKAGRPRNLETESVPNRTCPDCHHTSPTRSALGAHVRYKHGKKLADYAWAS